MRVTKNIFVLFGYLTLLGYSLVGLLLIYFVQQRDINDVLQGEALWLQILVGLVYGIVTALGISAIVDTKAFTPVRTFFTELMDMLRFKLSFTDGFFISLYAGIGEEMLFRAGIQPIIGLWATSVLFIALHGYIRFKHYSWVLFGIIMVLMSAGLGYLYEYLGLVSAMTAHAAFDVMGFRHLLKE